MTIKATLTNFFWGSSAVLILMSASADESRAQAKRGAAAEPAAAATAPQVPWFVNCATVKGAVACEAVQRLTIRQSGQTLLGVTVKKPPASKDATMMLQLPHGMFLPDGVSMQIDSNAAKQEPVQTCDQKGCYVGLVIDKKMLKTLKSGKKLSISFKNLAKREINVSITLNGFEEAYQKLL